MFIQFVIITISLFVFNTPQSFAGSLQNTTICQQVKKKAGQGALLVDVRTKQEFEAGALPGAINVPFDQIALQKHLFPADRKNEIILYCKSGRRSELGKRTLTKLGYINVLNAGGYVDLLKCWDIK